MTDPMTLTAGAIATLAFQEFVKTTTGESTKKVIGPILGKVNELRKKIWAKLRGAKAMQQAEQTVEQDQPLTPEQLDQIAAHLRVAMDDDTKFAAEIQNLAQEIQQQINIAQMEGSEVWNVIGKAEKTEFNDNKAPILKDVHGSTIHISYGGNPPAGT